MSPANNSTNAFRDLHPLEVSRTTKHPESRGSCVVGQTGSGPRVPELRKGTIALTRLGTWMPGNILFLPLRELRRKVALFETVPEVLRLAESPTGDAAVEIINSPPDLLEGAGRRMTNWNAQPCWLNAGNDIRTN